MADLNIVDSQFGINGSAGSITIYPSSSNLGKLVINATNSASNYNTTIQNASFGASRTLTIPDAGASANFVMTASAQTVASVQTFTGIPVFSAQGYSLVSGYVEDQWSPTVTITTAQVKLLATTGIQVVAAPGANLCVIPLGAQLYTAGGTAYTSVGGTLRLYYDTSGTSSASGVVNQTGFLDQTTAQQRYMPPFGGTGSANIVPAVNTAIYLCASTTNPATGNYGINIRVQYKIVPSTL